MRPIDADVLIEKCGDWYVEEGTESGFIGTLKNLLATEPTIQSQSTTGQLNDGARSTAQSTDLIDRQAAIDALSHMCSEDEDGITVSRANVNSMLKVLPSAQPGLDSENLVRTIETGITATNSSDAYSLGMRNGMRWCKSLIDGVEPKFEDDVMSVDDGKELPSVQPEPTCKQVAEYCKRRCLHVVTDDFFHIAQPEPHEGEWEQVSAQRYFMSASYFYRCSACGVNNVRNTNFCPHCGAKMTISTK